MASTYQLIASSTAGSGGVANFDFTSIPSDFTNLNLVLSLRASSGGGNWTGTRIQLNGSTSSYDTRILYGDGSGGSAVSFPSAAVDYVGGWNNTNNTTSNSFSSHSVYFLNYTSSNYKSISTDSAIETMATSALMSFVAGLWSNTSAINQITIIPNEGGTFLQYSSAYLYGIKNS